MNLYQMIKKLFQQQQITHQILFAPLKKKIFFGTQFHPEKSDKIGLKMIDNFLKL